MVEKVIVILGMASLYGLAIFLHWKLPPCSGQPGAGKVCLYCDCPRLQELYKN